MADLQGQATVEAVAVWLWNKEFRHLDRTVLQGARQRSRWVQEACLPDVPLDRRRLKGMIGWIADEVAAAVEPTPALAGLAVEVPRPDEWIVDPAWSLQSSGRAYADVVNAAWANAQAADLIRKIYKYARQNLQGWVSHRPRLKAAKVQHGERQVTAQRRERLKAPEDPHSWHTPEAIAEARSTLHALYATATPRERQIHSLLAKGYSDDEVATALRCQPSVVYTNSYRLQKKHPH